MNQVDKMVEIDDEEVVGTNVPRENKTGWEHQQCSQCKEIKPKAEFKRLLTKAESARLLRRPTNTRLTTISKKCKACWANIKRTKPLTRKEIRNKISSGDMHAHLGEAKIKELDESANAKKKRGMKNRWDNHRAVLLAQYRKKLMGFVRVKYVYWKGCKNEQLKQWAELDYLTAKNHMETLLKNYNHRDKPVPPEQISDCYTPQELADLHNLFNNIPDSVRSRLRRSR